MDLSQVLQSKFFQIITLNTSNFCQEFVATKLPNIVQYFHLLLLYRIFVPLASLVSC